MEHHAVRTIRFTCFAAATLALGLLHDGGTIVNGARSADSRALQSTTAKFGGTYSTLDARRRQMVDDWTARFAQATGQVVPPQRLYDEALTLSTKTTFDAITNALMATALTDESGAALGDALSLVERVEAVRGEIPGARGDHQFRMYARLTSNAVETLERSQQFRRGADNSVFHKGFPINYRGQGGTPSIQFSLALDERRADIDVDYRSSKFPVGLFNGHLTSSNSDVRAGDNFDRHVNRWAGFQNWWRSFFGIRLRNAPDEVSGSPLAIPPTPRAGKKPIDAMVNDFLQAWLIEGDIVAAMGYVSESAYACLAEDLDDPAEFDRGIAPYTLMVRLKAAHEAVGARTTLQGLTVGVRFARPGLKVVTQPHHAQFVVYAVPDDIAAQFDCESRLTLSEGRTVRRAYGNFYGATFNVAGARDQTVALLWGNVGGYWKIVAWRTGAEAREPPAPPLPSAARPVVVQADATLVEAANDFLSRWLVRKDYDGAFAYLSPRSYPCYDILASPGQLVTKTAAEAGQGLRQALERSGQRVGRGRTLSQILAPLEPSHPLVRLLAHQYSDTFALTGLPTALANAADCAALARRERFPRTYALEYGQGFGLNVRFRTRGGETPVLRILWTRESGAWRIVAFDMETP